MLQMTHQHSQTSSSTAVPTPSATRKLAKTALPRSLKEPVGFKYSVFTATRCSNKFAQINGVFPSPRVITGADFR